MRRLGYVDTREGQVHFRVAGPEGGRPVVLLHWTPASGRQYEPVLDALAARGWRAIAPDLLGYGRSDPRPANYGIPDFAANLDAALTALSIDAAPVVGGHVSACVAVELARLRGARVPRLVLDGCPLWPPEVRAQMAKFVAGTPPRVSADGAHRTLPWDRVEAFVREWRPGFVPTDADLPWLYALVVDYLETRFATSAAALAAYDLAAALPAIRVPTLFLTAATDPLRGHHDAARSLVTGSVEHRFEGTHPLHAAERADDYAQVLDRFLRPQVSGEDR